MNRMRNEAAAALVTILVVVAGGAGYLVGTNEAQEGTSVYPLATFQACYGQEVWNEYSNSSLVTALLMQPNTTANICVTYQTAWKGDPSYNFSVYLSSPFVLYHFYPFDVSNEQCTRSGSGTACYPDVSNAFEVSVFPTTVNLTAHTNSVAVLYTVKALANSTGYYSNGPGFACDFGFPLAVGHGASEVNGSDFGPSFPVQCALTIGGPLLSPVSVIVSGMNVIHLKS